MRTTVIETDELGRYMVASESEKLPHLVDLLANQGYGECSCKDWECRCSPNIKAKITGDYLPVAYQTNGATQCKHVRSAEIVMWTNIKLALVKRQQEGGEE